MTSKVDHAVGDRVYASLGFLVEPGEEAGVRWLEANRGYSEWDEEFEELLDFLSGVNTEADVHSFLRAEGAEQGTVDDLVNAGLLVALRGDDAQKVALLNGRRMVATSDLVESSDPSDGVDTVGVLESRFASRQRVRVTEPMLTVLSNTSGDDIPTTISSASERFGVGVDELAARFMVDLDLVLGSRTAFLGD